MNINNISSSYLEQYLAIISLDRVIEIIQSKDSNIPISFIIQQLDKKRRSLFEIEHYTPFIFIKKNYPIINNLYGNKKFYIFDNDEENDFFYLNDYLASYYTFNALHYVDFNIDDIVDECYKIFNLFSKENIRKNILDIRAEIKNYDVFMLLSDIKTLVEGIVFEEDDVFYIHKYIDLERANKSAEFFEDQVYEEEKTTLENENQHLRTKLAEAEHQIKQLRLMLAHQADSKIINGKSETAYLNIIQALKDELLATGNYKNQADLIESLAGKYQGYTGLAESNLRGKFAKANQIK